MAVDYTKETIEERDGRVLLIKWTGLSAGSDATPVQLPQYADRTVQITSSSWGTGSAALKGSLDGTTYGTLTDPQGNDISSTANMLKAVTEVVAYAKPVVSGDATDVDVTLLIKVTT